MSISDEPAAVVDLLSPTSWAASCRRPARVLLALTSERTVPRALQEAESFARRLRAELHLLRVVPHFDPDVQGPPRELSEAVREAQRVLAAARHTRKLCDRMLPATLPSARICVRLGRFVDQVAQRAAELESLIVVISPGTRQLAATVTELARRTGCPVLVPKGCASFDTLIAATDLEDARTPVLEMAAELGRELDAAVVAVHSLVVAAGAAAPATLEECHLRLERAAEALDGHFEASVRRATDAAQGILEQARARGAGLIVVGTRPRTDRSRPSTATQLVRHARHSVIVAPLDAPHALLHRASVS